MTDKKQIIEPNILPNTKLSKKLRYHDFPEFKDKVIEPAKLKF